jgi:hypothetical protein
MSVATSTKAELDALLVALGRMVGERDVQLRLHPWVVLAMPLRESGAARGRPAKGLVGVAGRD